MAKRVYDLAKELKIESKVILEALNGTKYAVKQASSGLGEEAVKLIRERFQGAKEVQTPLETPVKAAKAPEASKAAPAKEVQTSQEAQDSQEVPAKAVKASEESKPAPAKAQQASAEAKTPVKTQASDRKVNGRTDAKTASRPEGARMESTRPAAGKTDPAKTKTVKKEGDGKERPKKKASISALYNPQYSRSAKGKGSGGSGGGAAGSGNGKKGAGRGARRDNGGARPETHSIIKPRPVGERAMRPISERTADNKDDFSDIRAKIEQRSSAKNEQRSNAANEQRSERTTGGRQDRPANAEKSAKAAIGNGAGGRSGGGTRQDRPSAGERGNRPSDKNNTGGRGNNNNKGNGAKGGKNRFERDVEKFNKEAAPAEEVRGKESRDRGNDRNKKKNNNQNRDKLGGRKQENYVNLEKKTGRKKPQAQPQPKEDENVIKTITLPEKLTIRELADKMKQQPSAVVKKLFLKGQMVTVNQEVDFETAEEIALEFNFICEQEEKVDVIAELLKEEEESVEDMVARPPVVCVMGHVDHGKTSLLDAIRSTRVTDREAGGITQHIGASVVSINDQMITFLDTPGHEAFTAMRMRGANSTDIAILVVAADDGVMPQTVEAINHAKAAGVEIIVAVNKIDKPSANVEKVKQELSEYELIPEDWGGSTIFCPVSAHTGEGIDNLLEMILLTAEVLELKANPKRKARGLVIEAQLDKGRGAVATVLVQKGVLRVGDPVGCGSSYGKIRAMMDDKGHRVKEAGPSTPVEILGLNSVPDAGETFVVCDSDKEAKAFADTFISEEKNRLIEDTRAKMSLDDLFSQIQSGNMKELDIIVKADVQGSVEAVRQSLVKLSNEEVVVKVIHGGVGAINESDVILASASNAIIIGFNVRPDPMAKSTAEREGVDVRLYKVIYNAIEDVEAAMKGMLDPVFEEKIIGHAEIRQIFKASGVGNIAGSYVLDGVIERGCRVRISREGEQIFEGDLASLKRFKDDVKEVKSGYECGLVFDGFGDIQEFDVVEAYKMVEVPR